MTTTMKALELGGRRLGTHDRALICAPLVGRTAAALQAEMAAILPKAPDLIEWRVDFFTALDDSAQVLAAAALLRTLAGGTPLVFTRRAVHEGGEAIALAEDAVVNLYALLCASGYVDVIDYELSQSEAHRRRLRAVSQAHGVALILSSHDFTATPGVEEMKDTLRRAAGAGADIAKLAVMPRNRADVLRLLDATLQASSELPVPLITMSMGALGAISRVCGWQFGSAVSFAAGLQPSAPGQMPIDTLRLAMQAGA